MQTQECSWSGETQFRTLWPKLLPVFCGTCLVSRNSTDLFSRKYFWWKGVWQISGFVCSFADVPWSSYMQPHAKFRFLSKLFSWVCQPTKKKQFVRPFRTDAWSKQRCPRVMMITWRHCDGRPTEVSEKLFSDPDALSKVTFHPFHPLRKLTPRSSSLSVSHIVGGGALGAGSNGQSFITSTILNHQDRPALQDSAGWLCRGMSNFCWWFSNFSLCFLHFFSFP